MKNSLLLAALLGALAPLGSTACSSDVDGVEQSQVGQASLPLEVVTVNGVRYRLLGATFEITGASSQTISPPDDAERLSLDLAPGAYEINLVDGWSLARVESDETLTPVDAMLTSANPQSFFIRDGLVTRLRFEFETSGGPVSLGDGNLDVEIGVHESTTLLLGDFENPSAVDVPGEWRVIGLEMSPVQTPSDAPVPEGLRYARVSFSNPDPTAWQWVVFQSAAPIDATNYSFLSFSYRSTGEMFVSLQTSETLPAADGGTCEGTCYDGFSTSYLQSDAWVDVTLPLASLTQGGWGTPAANGLVDVLAIDFSVLGGPATIDLDNVRFE